MVTKDKTAALVSHIKADMNLGALVILVSLSLTSASPTISIAGKSGLKLSIPGNHDILNYSENSTLFGFFFKFHMLTCKTNIIKMHINAFFSDEDGISLVIFSVRNQNGESRDYVIETKNKGKPIPSNPRLNLNSTLLNVIKLTK